MDGFNDLSLTEQDKYVDCTDNWLYYIPSVSGEDTKGKPANVASTSSLQSQTMTLKAQIHYRVYVNFVHFWI